jgi:hypothetical protein
MGSISLKSLIGDAGSQTGLGQLLAVGLLNLDLTEQQLPLASPTSAMIQVYQTTHSSQRS